MTPVEEIARRFDARAARYDNPWTGFVGERELRAIRRLVPAGAEVLDYGCGTGRAALDHLRRGCRVTAFDISSGMLAAARAKARRLGWQAEFTTEASRLAGRRWPFVTCIGVADYYPDPVPLLRNLKQCLAEDGRLILTYPNALSPLGWAYAAASRLTLPATPRTPRSARRAAAQAGLRVLRLDYAFPSLAPLGHTLVMELARAPDLERGPGDDAGGTDRRWIAGLRDGAR